MAVRWLAKGRVRSLDVGQDDRSSLEDDHRVGIIAGHREPQPDDRLRLRKSPPAHDFQVTIPQQLHRRAIIGHHPIQLLQDALQPLVQAQGLGNRCCCLSQRLRLTPPGSLLFQQSRLFQSGGSQRGEVLQ